MKKIINLILVLIITFVLTACINHEKDADDFYYPKLDNPLKEVDMGGYETLTLIESSNQIIIENEKIRIAVNSKTGGIIEIANKEAHAYLTKDADSTPFTVIKKDKQRVESTFKNYSYQIITDSEDLKKIQFKWTLNNDAEIHGFISLTEHSDELIFEIAVINNDISDSIHAVEYPIIQKIDNIYDDTRDVLIHPLASGYIFSDPVKTFNRDDFKGITREYGLYPSGWESPMQFYAYSSLGIGGFMFMTKDDGTTIKSFPFIGEEGKIRASIYHYLDDLSLSNHPFDYEISISNLVKGDWYEAADKYRNWTSSQPWVTDTTKLSTRENYDQQFYEDTSLVNFNFPYSLVYGESNQRDLYEITSNSLNGGHMLNIFFNDGDQIIQLSKEFNDQLILFEFPDFYSVSIANETPLAWNNAVIDINGKYSIYSGLDSKYFYECAGSKDYIQRFTQREINIYHKYKVDGFYHDVGIAAPHPKQCFNPNHDHGSRINVISEYLDQMKLINEINSSFGLALYGQELVFEQMLPYVNYYQARANASLVGWMESDRIRSIIEDNLATKISLFDYVYSGYGVVRFDGFLYADELVGDSYYHIAASTLLNGGIPEYNYEFSNVNGNNLAVNEMDIEMMQYIGYLGDIRRGYGKDYLVFGDMIRPPQVSNLKQEYDYIQQRFFMHTDGGTVTFDQFISVAYEYENKIGIFICNSTMKDQELKFLINTFEDYGISSGQISIIDENGSTELTSINDGFARIQLNLESHQIVLLEISK